MITGYRVACTDGTGDDNTLTTTDTTATVGELTPYSRYVCSVVAFTNVGDGPPATLTITTATDGKHVAASLSYSIPICSIRRHSRVVAAIK